VSTVSYAREQSTPDDDRLYQRVVDLLSEWNPDDVGDFGLERELQRYLRRHLHDEFPDALPRVETDTGLASYDVVVGQAVAVKCYREFASGTVSEFRRLTQADSTRYPYLVICALDLPDADLGRWRMGKLRYTASRSGFDDITYLRHASETADPATDSRWPTALWHYAEVIVALCAILIGLEIAVLLNLEFGGLAPIMGPLTTGATVLVLAGLLVLVYEQTEI